MYIITEKGATMLYFTPKEMADPDGFLLQEI